MRSIFKRISAWFNGRPVVSPRVHVVVEVNPPSGGDDTAMVQEKIDLAYLVATMIPADVSVRFPPGRWSVK